MRKVKERKFQLHNLTLLESPPRQWQIKKAQGAGKRKAGGRDGDSEGNCFGGDQKVTLIMQRGLTLIVRLFSVLVLNCPLFTSIFSLSWIFSLSRRYCT